MFEVGAKEVHYFIVSPPVRFPDFYGIDTPKQADLFASSRTVKQMEKELGATSLKFLSLDGLVKAVGIPRKNLCCSCFNGEYPIDLLERKKEVNHNVPKN